eukprot:7108164-Pyramimonas_sp.AAC.1
MACTTETPGRVAHCVPTGWGAMAAHALSHVRTRYDATEIGREASVLGLGIPTTRQQKRKSTRASGRPAGSPAARVVATHNV